MNKYKKIAISSPIMFADEIQIKARCADMAKDGSQQLFKSDKD